MKPNTLTQSLCLYVFIQILVYWNMCVCVYVPLCKIEMSFQIKEGVAVHENDISKKCCKNICVSQRPNLVLLKAAEQCSVDWRN